jgi:hypothetical protein
VEGDGPEPAGEVLCALRLSPAELEPGVGAGVLGQGLGAAQPVAGHPHEPVVMAAEELGLIPSKRVPPLLLRAHWG